MNLPPLRRDTLVRSRIAARAAVLSAQREELLEALDVIGELHLIVAHRLDELDADTDRLWADLFPETQVEAAE